MSLPETRTRRTPSKAADALVGERAHMLIWRSGRTQESVAEALGVDAGGFGKKLKGKRGWATQEILDLAGELETTVAYLFGESDEPFSSDPDDGVSGETPRKITNRYIDSDRSTRHLRIAA